MKYKAFKVPMYSAIFVPLFGVSSEVAKRFVKKHFGLDCDFNAGGMCVTASGVTGIEKGDIISIVWLPEFKMNPYCIGVLSHEINHACLLTLHGRGQKVHGEDHEHFTYFVQHVTQGLLELWVKNKR